MALVGPSGCGKSTIVAMLERFYAPAKGQISIDGVDLAELNAHWWRDQIGYVGQQPVRGARSCLSLLFRSNAVDQVLFSGSIAENIAMGVAMSLDQARLFERGQLPCTMTEVREGEREREKIINKEREGKEKEKGKAYISMGLKLPI